RNELGSMRSLRLAIVWLLLLACFPAAATNFFVLIRLEVAHKHVKLDCSLLRRLIVAFLGRHATSSTDNDTNDCTFDLSRKNVCVLNLKQPKTPGHSCNLAFVQPK